MAEAKVLTYLSYLLFTALGNLESNQINRAIPALENLMKMEGALGIITILALPSLVGLLLLALGLMLSKIISKWEGLSIIIGCILFVLFIDLDNWMFIAASLMLIGLLPTNNKLLKSTHPTMQRHTNRR
ncbi:MAG: hypothetical protein ACOZAN_02475 [Patescibacteria group bacterium]